LAVATSYQAKHMADVYWGEILFFFDLFFFFPCFVLSSILWELKQNSIFVIQKKICPHLNLKMHPKVIV
jgi:hypothetical protein